MFQSDNVVEYVNLSKVLQAQGIIHRFSCPHIHQQNDSTERKHKQIVKIGLTLLTGAFLPLKFWGEAFTTVVQLINYLSTPLLNNQSPIETLFHKKPLYESFRVFGCLCFPYTRPYNQDKLDFRSTPSVFLGYATIRVINVLHP